MPAPIEPPRVWLIWSNRKEQWWKRASMGYTLNIEEAGRYTREDAEFIIERTSAGDAPHNFVVLAPEVTNG